MTGLPESVPDALVPHLSKPEWASWSLTLAAFPVILVRGKGLGIAGAQGLRTVSQSHGGCPVPSPTGLGVRPLPSAPSFLQARKQQQKHRLENLHGAMYT